MEKAEGIYKESAELQQILKSPIVNYENKVKVVEKIFPAEIHSFLKLVCYYNKGAYLSEIFQYYRELVKQENSILSAELYYVVSPTEAYITQMKEFLKNKYQAKEIELNLIQDTTLIGGFLLQVGNMQYDCSTRGAVTRLSQKLVRR